MKHETATELAKLSPPSAVGGFNLLGIPLPEVVTMLTVAYMVFLILDKLPVVIERLRQFVQWLKGFKNG